MGDESHRDPVGVSVGDDGQRVAALGASSATEGGLELFSGGERRGSLLASNGAAGLNLVNAEGETVARIVVGDDGQLDLIGVAAAP